MRTTIDLDEDAWQIARTLAHERKLSMGKVISEFISRSGSAVGDGHNPADADSAFPTFRCTRRVTSEDIRTLDDEG